MLRLGTAVAVFAMSVLAGCAADRDASAPDTGSPPELSGPGYRVVRTLPHDPHAFTQGLVIADGALFESTGQRGAGSSIRRIDLATGKVISKVTLQGLYGEGLAVHGGRLYQVTWRDQVLMTYDLQLNRLSEERFPREAWGLTSDESRLILSDGTDTLTMLDPRTLAVSKTVHVSDDGTPITRLNELERLGGDVLANVLGSPNIARIDLASGRVRDWLDLSALVEDVTAPDEEAVMNGIAFDDKTGQLYVTGKLWPTIYVLELSEP